MQIGADEAGKGPVLGPMVAAAVRAPASTLPAGVDDSKRLAPARRRELADQIRSADAVSVGVAVISPTRIDDPETDMNGLTVAGQVEAIADVAHDDDSVVVDAGDVDAERFGRRVAAGVDAAVTVRSEHRADENHAHVAAASVVAKVVRDSRVEALAETYSIYLLLAYTAVYLLLGAALLATRRRDLQRLARITVANIRGTPLPEPERAD